MNIFDPTKTKLLYDYDKPIIWNLSVFGNEYLMFTLENIIEILKKYNIECPISTIHGSYSCKYNGGREALYFSNRNSIEEKIRLYNDLGIGVKLTFSNMNIHKEQFEEEEMRWYLDLLNETKGIGNGIICVNDDFAELVKKNYPDLDLVASHVKMELETKIGITDTVDYYNSKFDLYDIVVFNTYRAFDDEFLNQIKYPDRIEFIVNHSCTTNCQMAKYHHELIDKMQLKKNDNHNDKRLLNKDKEAKEINDEINMLLKKCIAIKEMNDNEKLCRQFLNRTEINHLLNTHNINRFKIEGRDLSLFEFIIALDKYILNNESIYDIIHNEYTMPTKQDKLKVMQYKRISFDQIY